MGLPVLVLGQSGSGKSASLRGFDQSKVAVINVAGKPLPFKNKIQSETTDDYRKVLVALKKYAADGKKSIVIDDAQYLMANEFMRRATERGFDKFTEIAQNFWALVNSVKDLPADVIVYFLAHIEVDANGNEKIKTIGKLLDEKITVEGMFTIVLKTNVTDGVYSFLTQNNGHDTTKSPIGMFPTYAIDNDLNYVDEKIRNYYEMGEFLSDEDIKEIDEAAAKVDFEPKQEGEKKSRRSRKAKENMDNDSESAPEQPTVSEGAGKSETEGTGRKRRNVSGDAETSGNDNNESTDSPEESAPTGRRRRRVSDEMAEEREAVKQENDAAIANAGIEESGDAEEVPLEDVEKPEVKEMPRRKRRGAAETTEVPAMNEPEEPAEEATPRRRRRR